MAEKEERIRVLIAKNPCKECSVKNCTRKCMFSLLFEKAPGMTRQEAIERIEKVLEEGWWSGKTFRQLSEAALNALLEDK